MSTPADPTSVLEAIRETQEIGVPMTGPDGPAPEDATLGETSP